MDPSKRVTEHWTIVEVQAWLRDRNLSDSQCEEFKGFDGRDLLALNRADLEPVVGKLKAVAMHNQLHPQLQSGPAVATDRATDHPSDEKNYHHRQRLDQHSARSNQDYVPTRYERDQRSPHQQCNGDRRFGTDDNTRRRNDMKRRDSLPPSRRSSSSSTPEGRPRHSERKALPDPLACGFDAHAANKNRPRPYDDIDERALKIVKHHPHPPRPLQPTTPSDDSRRKSHRRSRSPRGTSDRESKSVSPPNDTHGRARTSRSRPSQSTTKSSPTDSQTGRPSEVVSVVQVPDELGFMTEDIPALFDGEL
eukprot:m.558397 g.558397  ORF g.558397 m.558397 type:complete len:307 (+) comp22200_c0_seq1:194-1114(+)